MGKNKNNNISIENFSNGYILNLGGYSYTLSETHYLELSHIIMENITFRLRCSNCKANFLLTTKSLLTIESIKCNKCKELLLYML